MGVFYLVSWAPVVGGLLTVLIPLPLLWTANRQGLHAIFGGTVVVNSRPTNGEP
jgi:uncharacterized RDD family membrane protein YckC